MVNTSLPAGHVPATATQQKREDHKVASKRSTPDENGASRLK